MEGETLQPGWLHSCLLGRAYHLWQQWGPPIIVESFLQNDRWHCGTFPEISSKSGSSFPAGFTDDTGARLAVIPLGSRDPGRLWRAISSAHLLPGWQAAALQGSGAVASGRKQDLFLLSRRASLTHSLFAVQGRLCLLFEALPWTHPEDKLLPQNAASPYPVGALPRLPYFISLPLTEAQWG